MKPTKYFALLISFFLAAASSMSRAQAPGVPIERNEISLKDEALIRKASSLREAGRLLDDKKVTAALGHLRPAKIELKPASTQKLEPREIAALARRALVRVGWFYKCPHCDHWHVNVSAGYAISEDGIVVTCHHCVAPDSHKMREGYLVATNAEGDVFPVKEVLAADAAMDTAVVRVDAAGLTPLALHDQSHPGDAAWCLSDPMNRPSYFSAGLVNRFYWKEHDPAADASTFVGARHLRMNVSTDWAYGSSGAAVLDSCGNVIAHVSRILPLTSEDGSSGSKSKSKDDGEKEEISTLIVLHEAIPARAVKLLLNHPAATLNR
jgi:hypothetical protein